MEWTKTPRDSRLTLRVVLALLMAAALGACGGGGGVGGGAGASKTLYLAMTYGEPTVNVWRQVSLEAQISGLEGNAPSCAVVAGQLPSGLSLQSDNCRISGTPQEVGSAVATIRITVKGFEGQVDTPIQVSVAGPSAIYRFNTAVGVGPLTLGSPQAFAPIPHIGQSVVWTPQAGQSLEYQVTSGALTAGLVIDAATGVVSGTPSTLGPATFTISVVARQGDAAVSSSAPYSVRVDLPDISVGYENLRNTPYLVGDTVSAIPTMRFGSGLKAGDYQFTFALRNGTSGLPAGLSLNPQTGEIGGTLTGPVDSPRGDAVDYQQVVTVRAMTRGIEFELLGASWVGSVMPPPLAPGAGFKPAPTSSPTNSVLWQRVYAPSAQYQFANTMTVLDRLDQVVGPANSFDDFTSFSFSLETNSFSRLNVFLAPERVGAPQVWNQATVFPVRPLVAGLQVGTVSSADGGAIAAPKLSAGCSGSGAFKIHDIAFDGAGKLTRIAADYVQSCDSFGTSTVMGAIRHNSAVPLALDEVYAVAGRDRDVLEGTPLLLDASTSWSPVSPVVDTRWRQVSGPAFDLSACKPAGASCKTYAPLVAKGGASAVFELQVTTLSGRSATARLALQIRSVKDRLSLVQQRNAQARLATTVGSDLRFGVPTKFGTESIYLLQRADHFYVDAWGNRPFDPLTVSASTVAVSSSNAQAFVVPMEFSAVAPIVGNAFGDEFYTGLPSLECNQPQWQLALPALTRDPSDFTVVHSMAAWFEGRCPTGEPVYSRFWIDYEPVTPPTALASGPVTAPRGAAFTLNDAGSTSPLGPLKARLWTQVFGPAVKTVSKLADGGVQITPADNTPDGSMLVFVLEAVDKWGQPGLAMVRVTVSGGPAPLRVDGSRRGVVR